MTRLSREQIIPSDCRHCQFYFGKSFCRLERCFIEAETQENAESKTATPVIKREVIA